MDSQIRKKIKRDYLEEKRVAGIYQIGVENHDHCILGCSANVDAILNRHKTEFRFGTHLNRSLQGLWKSRGEDAFFFKVVDVLEPLSDPSYDSKEDLEDLLEMWREKAISSGYFIY